MQWKLHKKVIVMNLWYYSTGQLSSESIIIMRAGNVELNG